MTTITGSNVVLSNQDFLAFLCMSMFAQFVSDIA